MLIMSLLGLWGRRCGFFGGFGSFHDGAPASCLDWHMGRYCSSRPVDDVASCCLVDTKARPYYSSCCTSAGAVRAKRHRDSTA